MLHPLFAATSMFSQRKALEMIETVIKINRLSMFGSSRTKVLKRLQTISYVDKDKDETKIARSRCVIDSSVFSLYRIARIVGPSTSLKNALLYTAGA